jgi:hypothetical protein
MDQASEIDMETPVPLYRVAGTVYPEGIDILRAADESPWTSPFLRER